MTERQSFVKRGHRLSVLDPFAISALSESARPNATVKRAGLLIAVSREFVSVQHTMGIMCLAASTGIVLYASAKTSPYLVGSPKADSR